MDSPINHASIKIRYHTTKTIFGKDQRTPATRYISYPALSASLTLYIRQWVRISMLMHAYPRAFSPHARSRSCIFPAKASLRKVFLRLLSTHFVGIKIISFGSLKAGKIIYKYLEWLSGMINSLLGALGCRIRIISSLGNSYTGSACGLTVYEFLDWI